MRAKLYLYILVVLGALLALHVLHTNKIAFAQPASLDDAVKAVVRIRGCKRGVGCTLNQGSGVIIDPAGLILTARHITSVKADFFRIEMAGSR